MRHPAAKSRKQPSSGPNKQAVPKDVRLEYYDESSKNCHRNIVIAWSPVPDQPGAIQYGASIFRRSPDGPEAKLPFNKKQHRATALGRLRKHPVIVEMVSELPVGPLGASAPARKSEEELRRETNDDKELFEAALKAEEERWRSECRPRLQRRHEDFKSELRPCLYRHGVKNREAGGATTTDEVVLA